MSGPAAGGGLLQSLRRDSSTRQVLSALRRFDGRRVAVEVSAACQPEGDDESFGFIIRQAQGTGRVLLTKPDSPDPSVH